MGGFASALGGLGQANYQTAGNYYINASAATASNVWPLWNQAYATGATNQVYTVDCWPLWNQQQAAYFYQTAQLQQQYQYQYVEHQYVEPAVTEERRIAAEVATAKAEELLMKILSPKQREQYRTNGYFETEVNDKVYRIRKGRAGNVDLLGPHGRPIERLCAHPEIMCPDQDTMVSQLLTLEANEAEFRRIANITRLA